jgi:hypothetical protein
MKEVAIKALTTVQAMASIKIYEIEEKQAKGDWLTYDDHRTKAGVDALMLKYQNKKWF